VTADLQAVHEGEFAQMLVTETPRRSIGVVLSARKSRCLRSWWACSECSCYRPRSLNGTSAPEVSAEIALKRDSGLKALIRATEDQLAILDARFHWIFRFTIVTDRDAVAQRSLVIRDLVAKME
jgi:hypothetical protein